jgi:hypothetical protein
MAKTTWSPHTLASQFVGLCLALVLSEPESADIACLCVQLTSLDKGHSLAVLDKESSQFLKHCQLCQDPHYKEVWDRSYSNELGQLCQGIGMDDKAGGKWVAGTNTFHLTRYLDIPHHKRNKIIYTKVVCEHERGRTMKIVPGSQ